MRRARLAGVAAVPLMVRGSALCADSRLISRFDTETYFPFDTETSSGSFVHSSGLIAPPEPRGSGGHAQDPDLGARQPFFKAAAQALFTRPFAVKTQ